MAALILGGIGSILIIRAILDSPPIVALTDGMHCVLDKFSDIQTSVDERRFHKARNDARTKAASQPHHSNIH